MFYFDFLVQYLHPQTPSTEPFIACRVLSDTICWRGSAVHPNGSPQLFNLHHSAAAQLALNPNGLITDADDVIELSPVQGERLILSPSRAHM